MISERDIIYITKKQASVAVVTLAIFCLLIFMLGYFWGKQSVVDGLGQRITQESIHDQIDYSSMIQSISDRTREDESGSPQEASVTQEDAVVSDTHDANTGFNDVAKDDASKNKKKYSAILIGFGTKQGASDFVRRLQKHDISVQIRTRASKSASGKTKRAWYQVVTNVYDSKDELDTVINRIKKLERLKNSDIKII